ncbi:MAG TPA: sn-glycerol-3-phosphate ABC transporter ATP-binding protein UgpC [Opitutae bacterium]|nr:sn-glycerol-3-phosphate ABC transporter ATP-binding protein UgpC [Opitutae bacterium]HCY57875.1 sn-glycerol-3-phosphate ABC transporter ATP-binding protein UgpC [Opitutae bacterium]|tara:strand:- start:1719 stop:2813 length:1095 start_codon:yes stop_codon:yes gene_type:complete
MPFIEFTNLSKTFSNGFCALKEINFSVQKEEFLAVVGPSGCGKTTLLRILAGLETPSAGSIAVDGISINDQEPKERNIGMVFQNYALFPHLSTFDNMAFGLKSQKISKDEIKQLVLRSAQRLELSELLDRKPHQLSGGQKQRVALGRLLSKNPKIHLLDEPLSNLDAHLRNSMRVELKKLHMEHKSTTLFVTHDQVEAMTLGHRICVMRKGKVEQIGTPKEIYQSPSNQFVAQFFGSPPINLIKGNLSSAENGEVNFTGDGFAFKIPLNLVPTKAGQVVLGIRAEDIMLPSESESSSSSLLEAEILSVDDLGDSKVIHLRQDNLVILMKSTAGFKIPKNKIKYAPNWGKIHWFDAVRGHRLKKG